MQTLAHARVEVTTSEAVMKSKILGLLAVGLLAGPMVATAVPVSWEFRGSISQETGAAFADFSNLNVGDQFLILLSFDPSAALLQTDSGGVFSPGSRYRYDPSSLSASVTIGNTGPVAYAYDPNVAGSLLYLRDNSGDQVPNGEQVSDGLSFRIALPDRIFDIIMRGPVLDIFNGPGLPSTPDPRLAGLSLAVFQMSSLVDDGYVRGDLSSVQSVPEPGTLTLLGLGLAGLGLTRRRKAQ